MVKTSVRVLKAARSCIPTGRWLAGVEIRITTAFVNDCDKIGICEIELAITVALRKSFGEITTQDLHARDDPGYDGLCEGHDLYEAAWFSAHVGRNMYLKFSLFDGRLTIVKLSRIH